MFFKNYQNMATATEMITTFGGYCHRDVISDGQWFDMTNMSARKYPAITTRPNRQILTKVNGEEVSNVAAMVDMDGLVWLGKDGSLHAGGNVLPNFYTYTEAERQMVPMGGYLIVFPDKVWANAVKLRMGGEMVEDVDYGNLEANWEQGDDSNVLPIAESHTMRILPCKPDGSYWKYIPSNWKESQTAPTGTAPDEEGQVVVVTSQYPYKIYEYVAERKEWVNTWEHPGYLQTYPSQKPTDPEDGCLFLDGNETPAVMLQWYASSRMWNEVECCLRIESAEHFQDIKNGDIVSVSLPAHTTDELPVDYRDGVEYYSAHDVYILPSNLENVLVKAVGEVEIANDLGLTHYVAVKTANIPAGPNFSIMSINSYHRQLVNEYVGRLKDDETGILMFTRAQEEAAWLMTNEELIDKLPSLVLRDGYAKPVKVSRSVPDMDYVIESNNRLWGCFYGERDGKMLNEIYASKLGDFKNWNSFQGLSTDSYAASRGSDGPWTGAITMNNYPLFFKRNCLEKVYISASGAHQIATTKMPGVQPGSWRSMQIVDGVLFYLSDTGVMVYDGSLPDHISNDFGNVRYSDGVAGKQGYNYYLSVKSQDGTYSLFNLDTTKGVWHREDDTRLTQTADRGDVMYMLTEDGRLLTPGTLAELDEGELEGDFNWEIVSGAIGYQRAEQEYLLRLIPRIKLELGGSALVHVMFDDNGDWQRVACIEGNGTQSMKVPVKPRRCDHFRIKLSGIGEATLYTITREIERGSVET